MTSILDGCKMDYSKRVNDKDQRISELKKENEQLKRKNNKIESEKADLSRKLSELSLTYATPNLIQIPKSYFDSPIERARKTSNQLASHSSPAHTPELSIIQRSSQAIMSSQMEADKNVKSSQF